MRHGHTERAHKGRELPVEHSDNSRLGRVEDLCVARVVVNSVLAFRDAGRTILSHLKSPWTMLPSLGPPSGVLREYQSTRKSNEGIGPTGLSVSLSRTAACACETLVIDLRGVKIRFSRVQAAAPNSKWRDRPSEDGLKGGPHGWAKSSMEVREMLLTGSDEGKKVWWSQSCRDQSWPGRACGARLGSG